MSQRTKNLNTNQSVRRSERLRNNQKKTGDDQQIQTTAQIHSRINASQASNNDQHQRQFDVDNNRPDTNSVTTNLYRSNSEARTVVPSTSRSSNKSHVTSAKSTASNACRRLEVQLQFAKRKQEQERRQLEQQNELNILRLQEALELARIDEEYKTIESDSSQRSHVSNEINNNHNQQPDKMDDVADWVETINQHDHDITAAPNVHSREPVPLPIQNYGAQPKVRRQSAPFDNSLNVRRNDYEDIQEIQRPRLPPERDFLQQRQRYAEDQQPRLQNVENWITRQTVSKELPKFSGNPMEWPQFIVQYETTTNICNLSNVENQLRLQKSLSGQALSVVQPLLIFPNNVDRVIEILRNRFGRTEHIVHLLLDRVRNFSLLKEDKVNSLIEFFDLLSNMVYTLESLNEYDHIRNPILYNEILNKLPISQRIDFVQFYDSLNTDRPPILILHRWLEGKVNAASKLLLPNFTKHPRDDKNDFKTQKSKGMTFVVTDNCDDTKNSKTVPNVNLYPCFYCKATGHLINSCDSFKNLKVDKRWDFITKNKACISCLRPKHSLKQCRTKKRCTENNCTFFHNPLLHKTSSQNSVSSKEENASASTETNCHVYEDNNYSLLKILPVVIKGPKMTLNTFAMLDEGSTVTLIDSNIAFQLGLEGPMKHLQLQWTNDQTNDQKDSQIVSIAIKGVNESNSYYTLRRARTISDLNLPTQTVDMNYICEKYPYLNHLKHLSYQNGKPMIIIGQDNWPVVVSRKLTRGAWDGPTASKTLLGWTVHGNVTGIRSEPRVLFHVHEVTSDETQIETKDDQDDLNIIQNMIKQQWSFDISGTLPVKKINPSLDDVRCMDIFDKTIKRVDDRFESGLLWKEDNIVLPQSKITALKRLTTLERKMDRNPDYAQAYISKIDDYIDKGYIKKLTRLEAGKENNKTWYLPHFGVTNPNKPGKFRIVFDAAAKTNGFCLNDFLLTGPDLYNSLPDILMNFRTHNYAFIGDIKEMFLQILVRDDDKYAQRLLWRGLERNKDPDVYEIQVVFFGAKCSPSVAQEVKSRNAKEFIAEFPLACSEITDNHYMDDYLGGADTEEDAVQLIHDVNFIHKQGGFDMVNWISNSPKILDSIDESLRAKKTSPNLKLDDSISEERVLGMWWDYEEDVFKYKFKFGKIDSNVINYEKRPTKRDVLKILMSIFDPLGFLSNLIIVGKILMQSIWESGVIWDDPITDNQYEIWRNWSQNFKNAIYFRVPRLLTIFPKSKTIIDLHMFCDASEHAYAAVAYLRFRYENEIQCVLINSKARVAPLKPTSIPRLELQAAVLGSRLSNSIANSLKINIESTVLWSDSRIVLSWIKNRSKRFKTFVAQRVGEIHDLTDPMWWRYVPSKLNIADDATKNKPIDFSADSCWLRGPEFLYKCPTNWPEGNFSVNYVDSNEELKSEHIMLITESIKFDMIPDVLKFSKWNKFIRPIAWALKYIEKLYFKMKRIPLPYDTYELLPQDIVKAELVVFQKIQQDCYKTELTYLKQKKPFPKSSSLNSFSCILGDDGLIRVNGRLNNSTSVSPDGKCPIILSSKHDITRLLVNQYHELNNHLGTEKIICDIRTRLWVTNIRSVVKRVKYECQFCKNKKAQPTIPIMGQLPPSRVNRSLRPFIKCGIDYFGPIEITVNRRHEKRYGVIFTCMAIRAIHIEIAQDLSYNSFMHVFLQFGNRRGFPEEIFSDNGSNFKRANKEIQKALKSWPQDELVKFCTKRQCTWSFNPPLSPHMGGVWERLIQSVKKHLFIILRERYPREYVLRTLLCEIEGILNNRPLTPNSSDYNDAEPLTPNHFLIGPSSESYPIVPTNDENLTLLSMWTSSQKLADMFWKRWVSEYLPTILLSKKWMKDSKIMSVGDFVLIVDSENPRNCWPKGVIEKVYPAADGRVRVVDVKTKSGIFRRPVHKLVKLELLKENNSR